MTTPKPEPELEIEVRVLSEKWREVRMVYEVSHGRTGQPIHVRGDEAKSDIVMFVMAFAEGIANSSGAPALARGIEHLANWLHDRLGCTCKNTPH